MLAESAGVGWAAAGLLLVASGLGLLTGAGTRITGSLFVAAGALLIAVAFPVGDLDTGHVGVAAMSALAAATATYPRPVRDLPQCLVLTAVFLGSPWLLWRLGQTDGVDAADLAWVAFAVTMVVLAHLWWRLETVPAQSRGPLLWLLSTGSVTLFVTGIAVLAGSPPGLSSAADASVGLIGVAALVGARTAGALDGRWAASRAAAWSFSIACTFAGATLVFTLLESISGSSPGIVSLALATVACGLAWHPLLQMVQRVSDGALFGLRPDALTAVQREWRSASVTTRQPPSEHSSRAWCCRTPLSRLPVRTPSRSARAAPLGAPSPSTPTTSTSVSSSWGSARVISPSPVMTSECSPWPSPCWSRR